VTVRQGTPASHERVRNRLATPRGFGRTPAATFKKGQSSPSRIRNNRHFLREWRGICERATQNPTHAKLRGWSHEVAGSRSLRPAGARDKVLGWIRWNTSERPGVARLGAGRRMYLRVTALYASGHRLSCVFWHLRRPRARGPSDAPDHHQVARTLRYTRRRFTPFEARTHREDEPCPGPTDRRVEGRADDPRLGHGSAASGCQNAA
jgi:hypothetical protein